MATAGSPPHANGGGAGEGRRGVMRETWGGSGGGRGVTTRGMKGMRARDQRSTGLTGPAERSEAKREEAEQGRKSSEQHREKAETHRRRDEDERQISEEMRVTAEALREIHQRVAETAEGVRQ